MSPIINIGPCFFGNFLWTYYFPADSLWTYYIFRDLSMKTLDLSWINFEFTTIFANKLWIHSVLHEKNFGFTISFRQSTFNSIPFFANSLWIPQFVCEFTQIYYMFREFTMNNYRELTIYLCIHFQLTIYFANSLSIHCLYHETNNDSLSFWRNH